MPAPVRSSTGVRDHVRRDVPSDRLTVAAMAVLVYVAANVLHEGLGHGGACVLTGGAPRLWTSVSFQCDVASAGAGRLVAAGGTVTNLIAGGLAALAYRRSAPDRVAQRFCWWLFATVNLLQAFGYWLFSGVGRIGDWAVVMAPVEPQWLWRAVLAVAGGVLYWLATRRAFMALGRWIGGPASTRYAVGRRLAWVAYLTGALLYMLSGLLNPGGVFLLAVSAAAASLGGTSGLAWGANFLRDSKDGADTAATAARITGNPRLIVAAAIVALLFVFVLGPGISLR